MKCGKGPFPTREKSEKGAEFFDFWWKMRLPFLHFILHLLSRLLCDARLQPKVVKTVLVRVECGLSLDCNDL